MAVVPTSPSQPPQTCNSVPLPPPLPQNAAPLPPPPPPTASKRTEKPKNGAPKKADGPENVNNYPALLQQIRKGIKLKNINDGAPKKAVDSEQNKSLPAGAKKETKEEYVARIEKVREESEQRTMKNVQYPYPNLAPILARRVAMEYSDDEDEHESGVDDDEWNDDEEGTKTPDSDNVSDNEDLNAGQNVQDPQSLHRERSGGFDSGIGSRATSPLYPGQKTEEPLISPKPVNLKTKSEAPPAAQVNNPVNSEVQKLPNLDNIYLRFGGKANNLQIQNVIDQGKRK